MTLLAEPTRPDIDDLTDVHPGRRHLPHLVTVEILLFFALVLLGAAAYAPVFRSWGTFVGPVFGSAAVSSVLAITIRRRGIPARFGVLISLIGVGLYLSYTVLVGRLTAGVVPGPDTLRALREGVGHGWQRIVDDPLPIDDSTSGLVWLTTVTWIVAHLTTDLAQRTRFAALPLVPPLVLLGASLPLIAATGEPPMWLVASFIAVALIAVLVRAVPDSRTVRGLGGTATNLTEFHSRSVLSARLRLGLPIVAACVIAAPLIAEVATPGDAFDPRDLRSKVTVPESVSDPLGQLKTQISTTPPRAAFRVDFASPDDALDVQRVAVLHLDHFDGVRWTSTANFTRAGSELVTPASGGPGRDIAQSYTIASVQDPWLPTAGTAMRIDLPDVAYAPSSGDLLAPGSVSGLMYRVVSRVATPTTDDIESAARDDNPDLRDERTLDGTVPDSIRAAATTATEGATSAGDAMLRLEQYLESSFSYDAGAPPGHAYGRIERFLTQDRRGTAEQFAASFAVMARSLGFPARVVVGYKVVQEGDNGATPIQFVTSANYHAWVEVKFANLGWVAFDPTPKPGDTPLPPQDEPVAPATVAPTEQPGGQRTPQEAGPSEGLPEPDQPGRGVAANLLRYTGAVAVGLVVVGLLASAAVLQSKRRRRLRRRNASAPADQVVGAWDEVLDRLAELRFPLSSSMTPRDIARAGSAAYGMAAAEPLGLLVPAVSRAVFAREEPSAEAAARAWERTAAFERNLASMLTRRQRMLSRLSLRPFRR